MTNTYARDGYLSVTKASLARGGDKSSPSHTCDNNAKDTLKVKADLPRRPPAL